jgi:hypothetical protein
MRRFIPIISITFSGCFFGTFQTTEPVKQGEQKLQLGVTDNLSLGLGAGGTGIGPYAKWTAYRHPNYYLHLSTHIAFPQMDFIFGARANRFFSLFPKGDEGL